MRKKISRPSTGGHREPVVPGFKPTMSVHVDWLVLTNRLHFPSPNKGELMVRIQGMYRPSVLESIFALLRGNNIEIVGVMLQAILGKSGYFNLTLGLAGVLDAIRRIHEYFSVRPFVHCKITSAHARIPLLAPPAISLDRVLTGAETAQELLFQLAHAVAMECSAEKALPNAACIEALHFYDDESTRPNPITAYIKCASEKTRTNLGLRLKPLGWDPMNLFTFMTTTHLHPDPFPKGKPFGSPPPKDRFE